MSGFSDDELLASASRLASSGLARVRIVNPGRLKGQQGTIVTPGRDGDRLTIGLDSDPTRPVLLPPGGVVLLEHDSPPPPPSGLSQACANCGEEVATKKCTECGAGICSAECNIRLWAIHKPVCRARQAAEFGREFARKENRGLNLQHAAYPTTPRPCRSSSTN